MSSLHDDKLISEYERVVLKFIKNVGVTLAIFRESALKRQNSRWNNCRRHLRSIVITPDQIILQITIHSIKS